MNRHVVAHSQLVYYNSCLFLIRCELVRYRMAKSRNALPIATKIAMIDAVEAGDRSKSEVAKSFNIPKSTLSTPS